MTTLPTIPDMHTIQVVNDWTKVATEVVKQMSRLMKSEKWEVKLTEDNKDTYEAMRIEAYNYQRLMHYREIHPPKVTITLPKKEWGSYQHIYKYKDEKNSSDGFILEYEVYDEDFPAPLDILPDKTFELYTMNKSSEVWESVAVKVKFEFVTHIPPYYQREDPHVDCCGFDDKDIDLQTHEDMAPSDPESPTHYVHRYGQGEWDRHCYTDTFLRDFIQTGHGTKDPKRPNDDIYDESLTWSWEGLEKPNKATCAKRANIQDNEKASRRNPRPVSVRYRSLLSWLLI